MYQGRSFATSLVCSPFNLRATKILLEYKLNVDGGTEASKFWLSVPSARPLPLERQKYHKR